MAHRKSPEVIAGLNLRELYQVPLVFWPIVISVILAVTVGGINLVKNIG